MIAEQQWKVMRNFFSDVLNAHNLSLLETFLSPDFIHHTPQPGMRGDVQGFRQGLMVLFIAFHHLRYNVQSYQTNGGCVEVKWTATAAHPGGVLVKRGVAMPVGRQIVWQGSTRAHIRNGRIDEIWTYQDENSLLAQLSEMPPVLVEN